VGQGHRLRDRPRLRAGLHRLEQASRTASPPAARRAGPSDRVTRRVLPPRQEILEYLLSFDLFEQNGRPEEGRVYATFHVDRIMKTVERMPRLEGAVRVLELGANPYFMTLLVEKYLGYRVTPANFFGDYGEPTGGSDDITIRSARYGETRTFSFKIFNVEVDPYPYDDATFDLVLCCEI